MGRGAVTATSSGPLSRPGIRLARTGDGGLDAVLSGTWTLAGGPVRGDAVVAALAAAPPPARLRVATEGLERWDSTLVAFLLRLRTLAERAGVAMELDGLPAGVTRLVALAAAVPERTGTGREPSDDRALARIGRWAVAKLAGWRASTRFLGQVVLALVAFLRGRAVYRREDLVHTIQETGAQALPIVATISLLVGLILAFIGAVQLARFGAAIFVADLVGLAMTREMAAVMTAIVVAGRTGAAFAAQLGTMQGNEEIDALATLGVPPVEFLVLPRILALTLMMPLLTAPRA